MNKYYCLFTIVLLSFTVQLAQGQSKSPEYKKEDLSGLSLKQLLNKQAKSLEENADVEVTTAAQKAQKISDAPATVISISGRDIEIYGWRDLKDLLRALPGMDVSYDTQGEVRTLVRMRGVEGNQKILILQDGQRQNPITGERFVYGYNQPLHLYKSIEIVYGPASALYGADAYAGVINLITKDGADIDGLEATSGYVSTGAYTGSLTFGKAVDAQTDVVISGRIYQGNDFASVFTGRPFHQAYNDPLDYGAVGQYQGALGSYSSSYPVRNWNWFSKLRYRRFQIGTNWAHTYETNALSTIPANYAYTNNNVWGQDIRHAYIRHKTIDHKKISLENTVTFGDYRLNPASNFFIVQNSELTQALPSYKYAYSGYVRFQSQGHWSLSNRVLLTAGALYDRVKSFPKTKNLSSRFAPDQGLQDDLREFSDGNGYTFGLLGLQDSTFGERNYHNAGIYLQTEIKALSNLALTLGGRYDYNSIYHSTINPRAGLVYRPAKGLVLKGLFGTAYIPPSNYYRWENWANPFAMHIPNQNIRPERLLSYEFSAQYFLNDNAFIRGGVFQNQMEDIIRPVIAPTQAGEYPYYNPYRTQIGQSPHSGYVEVNANQGHMSSQGVETELRYRLGNLQTTLFYTYLTGKDNGYQLAKISNHKLNLNLAYTAQKLATSLAVRYYSPVSTTRDNSRYGDPALSPGATGTYQIPGTAILYANAIYSLTYRLKLHLAVDNLLNTKHYNSAPYAESVWIQPRAPQSLLKAYLGLTYKF